jgi:hypothetical protein
MAETRYHDYGSFIQAEDQNALQGFIFDAGILTGNALAVSADGAELEVSSGAVITSEGVVVYNDGVRTLSLQPQSDSTVYTLVQHHSFDLSGGRGSTYTLEEYVDGSTPKFGTYGDLSAGGVILGWVRYPGGSVEFTDVMLHRAPILRVAADLSFDFAADNWPLDIAAPLIVGAAMWVVLDSDVSVSHALDADGFPATTHTNDHAGLDKLATLYCMPAHPAVHRPKFVDLERLVFSDPTVLVTVSINVDGTTTLLATLTGALGGDVERIGIPDAVFTQAQLDAGVRWQIVLAATIPPTFSFTLSRVRANAGVLPYE